MLQGEKEGVLKLNLASDVMETDAPTDRVDDKERLNQSTSRAFVDLGRDGIKDLTDEFFCALVNKPLALLFPLFLCTAWGYSPNEFAKSVCRSKLDAPLSF